MKQPSKFKGGVGVVEHLMRTRLFRQLTEAQATNLWEECMTRLQNRGLQETVVECEESRTGSLDTLPRGDVLDELARILTDQDWPLNMASQAESESFLSQLRTAFQERAYARAEESAA